MALTGAPHLFDATTKGIPAGAAVDLETVGSMGWNVLAGDLPLPLATLREDVMAANSLWLSAFASMNGLVLAPHGKTTMAPALFQRQVADGAWGLTVATVQQLHVAAAAGMQHVILANQPIGANAGGCFAVMGAHPDLDLHVLADSVEGVAILAAAAPLGSRPLGVLVELGAVGGRTGCRTVEDALAVAKAVSASSSLRLTGVEAFEGVLGGVDEVRRLLGDVVETARRCDASGLFEPVGQIIVSAGGSSFFDEVGLAFKLLHLSRPVLKVLRSGCYLTHDSFGFTADFARVMEARLLPLPPGGLRPALQLWAYVQSRPDADKAILTLGKRDAGFDAGLPRPTQWYRRDLHDAPVALPEGHQITALNDQHAHLMLPAGSPLAVGDMVTMGIAHPCTTFDRWTVLMLIDAAHGVTGAVRTMF